MRKTKERIRFVLICYKLLTAPAREGTDQGNDRPRTLLYLVDGERRNHKIKNPD